METCRLGSRILPAFPLDRSRVARPLSEMQRKRIQIIRRFPIRLRGRLLGSRAGPSTSKSPHSHHRPCPLCPPCQDPLRIPRGNRRQWCASADAMTPKNALKEPPSRPQARLCAAIIPCFPFPWPPEIGKSNPKLVSRPPDSVSLITQLGIWGAGGA